MSSSDLNFYINKHRKAYEERLKKELENQENKKDNEDSKKNDENNEKERDIIKEGLNQVESDYLYALKLNESLNGSIMSNNGQCKNDINNFNESISNYKDLKENGNEKTEDNIREPDNTYVECLLEDTVLTPYCVNYNLRNVNNKSNYVNNNFNECNDIIISSDDEVHPNVLKNSSYFQNNDSCSKNDSISYEKKSEDISNINNKNLIDEKKAKKKSNDSVSISNKTNVVETNKEKCLKDKLIYENYRNDLLISDKKRFHNDKTPKKKSDHGAYSSSSSIQSIHVTKENSKFRKNKTKPCEEEEKEKIKNYNNSLAFDRNIRIYDNPNYSTEKKTEDARCFDNEGAFGYNVEKYQHKNNQMECEKLYKRNHNYINSKKTNNDDEKDSNTKYNIMKKEEIKSDSKHNFHTNSYNINNGFYDDEKDLYLNLKKKSDKDNDKNNDKKSNMENLYKKENLENKNNKIYDKNSRNDLEYNYKTSKNKRTSNILEKVNHMSYKNNSNIDNNGYFLRSSKKCLLSEETIKMYNNSKNVHLERSSSFVHTNNNNKDVEEKKFKNFSPFSKNETKEYNNTLNNMSQINNKETKYDLNYYCNNRNVKEYSDLLDIERNKTDNFLKNGKINNLNEYTINNALINIDNNSNVIPDKEQNYRINFENKYDSFTKNYKNEPLKGNIKPFCFNDDINNNKNIINHNSSLNNTKYDNLNKFNNKSDKISIENNSSYNKIHPYIVEDHFIYNNSNNDTKSISNNNNSTNSNNDIINISSANIHNSKNYKSYFNDKQDDIKLKKEKSSTVNTSYDIKTSSYNKNIIKDKKLCTNNYDSSNIFINNKNSSRNYNLINNSIDELFPSTTRNNKNINIFNDFNKNNNIYNRNNLDINNYDTHNKLCSNFLNSKEQSNKNDKNKNSFFENKLIIDERNNSLVNHKQYALKTDLSKNSTYDKNNKKDNSNSIKNDIINIFSDNNYKNNSSKHKNNMNNSSNNSNYNINNKNYTTKHNDGPNLNNFYNIMKSQNNNSKTHKDNKKEKLNCDSVYNNNNNNLTKDGYTYNQSNIEQKKKYIYIEGDHIHDTKINMSENQNVKNGSFYKMEFNNNNSNNTNRYKVYDYTKNDMEASSNDIKLSLSNKYIPNESNLTSKDLTKKENIYNNDIKSISNSKNNAYDLAISKNSKDYNNYSLNSISNGKGGDNYNNIVQNYNQHVDNNLYPSQSNEDITNDEDMLVQQAIINSLIDL